MTPMMTVSRRDVRRMLGALGEHDVPFTNDAESMAARLRSLAVASSVGATASHGRLKRQVIATVGAVGLVGWASFGTASAFVGLAATGNLPAPVQNFVSDVLDTVGVEVPRATPPKVPADQPGAGSDDTGGDAGTKTTDPVEESTTTTLPVDGLDSSGSKGNGNGHSGNNNGNSANGNSGNGNGSSGASPGNSGNSGINNNSGKGNSGRGRGDGGGGSGNSGRGSSDGSSTTDGDKGSGDSGTGGDTPSSGPDNSDRPASNGGPPHGGGVGSGGSTGAGAFGVPVSF